MAPGSTGILSFSIRLKEMQSGRQSDSSNFCNEKTTTQRLLETNWKCDSMQWGAVGELQPEAVKRRIFDTGVFDWKENKSRYYCFEITYHNTHSVERNW